MVAIGIDQYRHPGWTELRNAVSDARGAVRAFERLGFESKIAPVLDEAATRGAFDRLLEDLTTLGENDSLVVFFAGHGHTERQAFRDGTFRKIGYLVPADARREDEATWVRLDSWLQHIAQLPPRHILVVLDCCHSGIALAPPYRLHGEAAAKTLWRGAQTDDVLAAYRARRSRRVITSALDDQRASDEGPVSGHSLFTGCLITALGGEMFQKLGRGMATGSDIWNHLKYQVAELSDALQTPDFGALELDDRGELIVEISSAPETVATPAPPRVALGSGTTAPRTHRLGLADFQSPVTRVKVAAAPVPTSPPPPVRPAVEKAPPSARAGSNFVERTSSVEPRPRAPHARAHGLAPAFVNLLDRHLAERSRGREVVSVVAAEATTALTGWAGWAAANRMLTLVTEVTGVDAVTTELLASMPWLRLLPEARRCIAAAAGLDPAGLDAALQDHLPDDRAMWLEDQAGLDAQARVGGWLVSAVYEPWGNGLDMAAAPVQGRALLEAVCGLAAPVAVLFHHRAPDEAWLVQALRTAGELTSYMPKHAVAVAAPSQLIARVVGDPLNRLAKLRSNVVPLARAPRFGETGRRQLAALAYEALMDDPRTAGLFELDVPVPVHDHDRPILVDLVARTALLAIEIDDWYRSQDPQLYRAARSKDAQLQHAGYYVLRFLADDVELRLRTFVDEVALGLDGRRASGSFLENSHDAHAG